MILTIAGHELRRLFLSPLAWTLMAVFQFILAWLFLILVEEFSRHQSDWLGVPGAPGVTDLVAAPFLRVAAWLLLLLIPLLSMRLFSEERRHHTLELLLAAPLATHQIVLGKYLGLLGFLSILLVLIVALPLSLLFGGALDGGKLLAGALGLFLLAGSFAAAGLYLSTLTAQPAVAAVATFGLLLLLWIIDAAGANGEDSGAMFAYLSLFRHYQALLMGLFNSADVAYYLLFSGAFLGLAIRRLDNQRLQH
jgi:ABC-2 type transport system permease protein